MCAGVNSVLERIDLIAELGHVLERTRAAKRWRQLRLKDFGRKVTFVIFSG